MRLNKMFTLVLLCGINFTYAMQERLLDEQPQRTSWRDTVKSCAVRGGNLARAGWTGINGKQVFWEACLAAGACCVYSFLGNRQMLPGMSNTDVTKSLVGSVKESLRPGSASPWPSSVLFAFGRECGAKVAADAIKPGLAEKWTSFSSKIPAIFGATFAIKFAEEFGSRALVNGVRTTLVGSYNFMRTRAVNAYGRIKRAFRTYRVVSV